MLPVIDNRPINDFKLPSTKQIIHIKPYNSAQEKLLLQSLVKKDDKKFWLNNIKSVLEQNFVEKIDYGKMSALDFMWLTLKLRSISKGQIFEYSFKCPSFLKDEEGNITDKPCTHVFRESDTIDSLINIKNSDVVRKVCDVHDKLTLELIPPKISYYDYLTELNEQEIDEENDFALLSQNMELFMNQLAHSVEKVIIKNEMGKPTVYTDFTIQELIENILMNLTATELHKLYEAKSELINMSIRIRKFCPVCKEVFEKEDTNFFTYLV